MENLVTVFMGQTLLQGGTHARVYIRITMVSHTWACATLQQSLSHKNKTWQTLYTISVISFI